MLSVDNRTTLRRQCEGALRAWKVSMDGDACVVRKYETKSGDVCYCDLAWTFRLFVPRTARVIASFYTLDIHVRTVDVTVFKRECMCLGTKKRQHQAAVEKRNKRAVVCQWIRTECKRPYP